MKLADLFGALPLEYRPQPIPDLEVKGIAIDNRKVKPGDLFIAMVGGSADGHDFIPAAIRSGAVAVVGERPDPNLGVPYIRINRTRQALTWIAAAFYDHPGEHMTVIGVTGTDGKTTTSSLLHNILLAGGYQVGLISTVNAVIGDESLDTGFHVTTPDAPDVQDYLGRMVSGGMTHAILETTSHGLAQYRVDASEYDIAVFTNITHEHLDEHGSYENYLAAKRRLLELLVVTKQKPQGNHRLAILNRDDASYEYLHSYVDSQAGALRELSYGLTTKADVLAESIRHQPSGLEFSVAFKGKKVPLRTSLVGEFNIYNCLAAYTTAVVGLGVDPARAAVGIAALSGIPGRMERIDLGQDFTAIVDFAHTPNALRVALNAARTLTHVDKDGEREPTRVISVFGSAGLRDREKRRMMAEVSIRLADVSILTAEDPRTESLDTILEEMAAGAKSQGGVEGRTFFLVQDRREAIRLAVRMAQAGDIVISCGKGHEQSMCFGNIEYPWDDRVALRAALSEFLGIPGPQMPVLPDV